MTLILSLPRDDKPDATPLFVKNCSCVQETVGLAWHTYLKHIQANQTILVLKIRLPASLKLSKLTCRQHEVALFNDSFKMACFF